MSTGEMRGFTIEEVIYGFFWLGLIAGAVFLISRCNWFTF
jgi:hypothetical protein